MIRAGEKVFVDTGAWVALAVVRDDHHERAKTAWADMARMRAQIVTSIPVVIETFTFLDRRGSRELARSWRRSLDAVPRFRVLECGAADLGQAWTWIERKDMAKLGLVDATSFAIMKRRRVTAALAFDRHFSQAGFRIVG